MEKKRKKRRRKKRGMPVALKLLITVVCAAIVLVIIIALDGDKKEAPAESSAPAAAPSAPAAEAPKPAPSMSKEDFANIARQTFAENGLSCTVDIEDNMLVIKAYHDELTEDLALLALGDEKAIESWYVLRDGLVSMTTSMRNTAVSNGLNDLHVTFMLMNPLNKDATILTIADDYVFNDAMEEIINEKK